MNKNKQAYDRPTTDVLVVRFEGTLLQTSNYGSSRSAGRGFSSVNGNISDYTDGDDF